MRRTELAHAAPSLARFPGLHASRLVRTPMSLSLAAPAYVVPSRRPARASRSLRLLSLHPQRFFQRDDKEVRWPSTPMAVKPHRAGVSVYRGVRRACSKRRKRRRSGSSRPTREGGRILGYWAKFLAHAREFGADDWDGGVVSVRLRAPVLAQHSPEPLMALPGHTAVLCSSGDKKKRGEGRR